MKMYILYQAIHQNRKNNFFLCMIRGEIKALKNEIETLKVKHKMQKKSAIHIMVDG